MTIKNIFLEGSAVPGHGLNCVVVEDINRHTTRAIVQFKTLNYINWMFWSSGHKFCIVIISKCVMWKPKEGEMEETE